MFVIEGGFFFPLPCRSSDPVPFFGRLSDVWLFHTEVINVHLVLTLFRNRGLGWRQPCEAPHRFSYPQRHRRRHCHWIRPVIGEALAWPGSLQRYACIRTVLIRYLSGTPSVLVRYSLGTQSQYSWF